MYEAKRSARYEGKKKRQEEEKELEDIESKLREQAPPKSFNVVTDQLDDIKKTPEAYFPLATTFDQLPLSSRTKRALKDNKYETLTDIQRSALPHALVGRDILGTAKTGTGKTLCFLIPVIELLYRLKWSIEDGLGALILSPTRELAMQTFNVLRTIGARHLLSAGLLIGGKSFEEEQACLGNMNILVSTPGRLLQHSDESPTFTADNLKILVLDEVDQILDLGFEKELNAIIRNLPSKRQTLLFSATQTASIRTLSRLSLSDPEFITVYPKQDAITPQLLLQNYIVCDVDKKLDLLWSFIKAHLRQKILVFFSSQRQVRFVFEVFRRMRPGLPVLHIHGKMKQNTRIKYYYQFAKSDFAVLLATDLAARGLDFKGIHWVIQMDCPESVELYVHRVGRTARYKSGGKASLVLLPSELKFKDKLLENKIPISKTTLNADRILSIEAAIQALLIQFPELKFAAQKAVKSYIRSIHLMPDKEVFDVQKICVESLCKSIGLLQVPKLKFLNDKRIDKNKKKQQFKQQQLEQKIQEMVKENGTDDHIDLMKVFSKEKKPGKTRMERLLKKSNPLVFSESYENMREEMKVDPEFQVDSDGEDSAFLKIKPQDQSTHANMNLEEVSQCIRKRDRPDSKIKIYREPRDVLRFDSSSEDESEDLTVPYSKRVAREMKHADKDDKRAYSILLKKRRMKKKLSETAGLNSGEDSDSNSNFDKDENREKLKTTAV
ncbi:probable ATP-dependent RNA helicase ddx10 [Schistocerca gregaria]|uniref:probable ATP-dependent RNA helicase ddx10 n=1 Tax=Schistocerca gregaria TaxID=7010 RepID=UPI00211E7C05|nr:probable ATP-dependent RNA helicase ddx10 [Schistocerca gregaria]